MTKGWICPVNFHRLDDYRVMSRSTVGRWWVVIWCLRCHAKILVTKHGLRRIG
jgi:hypothetical protein